MLGSILSCVAEGKMKRPNDRFNNALIISGLLVAFVAAMKIYLYDPNPHFLTDLFARPDRPAAVALAPTTRFTLPQRDTDPVRVPKRDRVRLPKLDPVRIRQARPRPSQASSSTPPR